MYLQNPKHAASKLERTPSGLAATAGGCNANEVSLKIGFGYSSLATPFVDRIPRI
jgi:hypothetical protein